MALEVDNRTKIMAGVAVLVLAGAGAAAAAELPIFDAHLHYSHDAWDVVPPKAAIAILRKAGLKRALISSSGDDGQQRLYAEARERPLAARSALHDVDLSRNDQEQPVARIAFAEQFLAGGDLPGRDGRGDGIELGAAEPAAQRHSSQCCGVFHCHR